MSDALTMAQKMAITLELHELGVDMMLQTLKRRFPDESDAAIGERLWQWLRTRPVPKIATPSVA